MHSRSIATLFILMALVCAATGCDGATAKERVATDRPWEALPQDVIGAGWIDVRGLMSSEIGTELMGGELASQLDMAEFDRFVEATGFDPAKDLDSLTVGFGQKVGENRAPVYMIASGAFDVARLSQTLLKENPAPPRDIDGLMAYAIKTGADSEQGSRVGWLNEKTMLFAAENDIAGLVEAARSPRKSEASKALSRLMDAADGQLFMALEIPDSLREQMQETAREPGGNPLFAMMAPMSNLHSVLLSMNAADGLDLALTAVTGSVEDGRLLHDSLQGLLAMARMASGGDAETLERLNQVQLSVDGSALRLSIKMTKEQLASALADVEGSEGG